MILYCSDLSVEICTVCHKEYQEVYTVSDDLWKRVTGFQNGEGCICIECFSKIAFDKGIHIFWEGEEKIFISQLIKKKLLSIFGLKASGEYQCIKHGKKLKQDNRFEKEIAKILDHIYNLSGKRYRAAGNIYPRLREGVTVEELKQIATTKSCDPHFQARNWQYFNPVSLYTKKNFEVYLNQKPEDFGQIDSQDNLAEWEKRKSKEMSK